MIAAWLTAGLGLAGYVALALSGFGVINRDDNAGPLAPVMFNATTRIFGGLILFVGSLWVPNIWL